MVDALSRSVKVIHMEVVRIHETNFRERVKSAQETDAFFQTTKSYLEQDPTGIKYGDYQMMEEGLLT